MKYRGKGELLVAVSLGPEGAPAGAKVALTTSSAQSAAIAGDWIDVSSDVDCFVEIAANPTAVADTSYRLVAGTTYRFPITAGNKIAGIVASGTGNLWYRVVQ